MNTVASPLLSGATHQAQLTRVEGGQWDESPTEWHKSNTKPMGIPLLLPTDSSPQVSGGRHAGVVDRLDCHPADALDVNLTLDEDPIETPNGG